MTTRKVSGQSYKAPTIINYDSRVVLTIKLLIFTTLTIIEAL